MKARALAAALLVAISACEPSPSGPGTPLPVVESGTSFGLCGGYCTTRLVVDGSQVSFVETARLGQLPDRSRTLELTSAEQMRFYAALDPTAVQSLAGVHGCPDCADGGAEWIELGRTRVTFEYGKELPTIAALQREIRALRARFPR